MISLAPPCGEAETAGGAQVGCVAGGGMVGAGAAARARV